MLWNHPEPFVNGFLVSWRHYDRTNVFVSVGSEFKERVRVPSVGTRFIKTGSIFVVIATDQYKVNVGLARPQIPFDKGWDDVNVTFRKAWLLACSPEEPTLAIVDYVLGGAWKNGWRTVQRQ